MTNSILQKNDAELDKQLIDDLESIQKALRESEQVDTDSSIDKQILAAAYRESQVPHKSSEYRYSFWRKLSLPLYIGSGFVFTVLAYNSLLQPMQEDIRSDETASTVISIQSAEKPEASLTSPKIREKRELPILKAPDQIPQRVVTESSPTTIDIGTSESGESRLIEQGIYTGNELVKAEFPEKEAWAREIIGLLRSGEAQRAKNELNKFKKIYPDYPIEEQIKVLIH